ncbi:putative gustatory receptor 28a [Neodiprion pinetum]|uniref:putative gustatory receptor 28a n=1 Tax=Neodiprion pinetum TaxID=441929 RepID=UPI001EDE1108|nr:uncharacterized protein LOC124222780 [Neodiprion pinetum]
MKLPVPGTLRAAFAPTCTLNLIFGIDVLYYPKDKPRPLLSVIWALLTLTMDVVLLKMANFPELKVFMGSTIAATNYRLNAHIHTIFIAVSMFTSQFRSQATRNTFRKIISINAKLKTLGISYDYESVYKTQIIELVIGFTYMTILQIFDFLFVGLDYPNESARTSFLLGTHHHMFFTFIFDFTYNTSIRYFCNRFRRLNSLLVELELQRKGRMQPSQESVSTFSRRNSLVSNEIQGSAVSNRLMDNQRLLHIAKVVRKLHGDLCTTAMELSRIFGFQVFLSIALSFGVSIALLYTGYTLAADSPSSSMLDDVMVKIAAVLWIGFYIMKITWLVIGCTATTREAKKTGELIKNILESAAIYNKDIRDEIYILTLQLMQNPLCFTAQGFFTLDYTLLSKMIGSVATFLILMIQMRSIYELNNVRVNSTHSMLLAANRTA